MEFGSCVNMTSRGDGERRKDGRRCKERRGERDPENQNGENVVFEDPKNYQLCSFLPNFEI